MDDPTERILQRTRERRAMLDKELGKTSSSSSSITTTVSGPLAPLQTTTTATKRSTSDLKSSAQPLATRSPAGGDEPQLRSPPQKKPSFSDADATGTATTGSPDQSSGCTTGERTNTPRRRSLYPVQQLSELSQDAEDEDDENGGDATTTHMDKGFSTASESVSLMEAEASSSKSHAALLAQKCTHPRTAILSDSSVGGGGSSVVSRSPSSEARKARFARLASSISDMEDQIQTPMYNMPKEHFMTKKTPPSQRKSWGTPKTNPTKSPKDTGKITPKTASCSSNEETTQLTGSAKSIRFASPLAAMAWADESLSVASEGVGSVRSNTPQSMMSNGQQQRPVRLGDSDSNTDTDVAPPSTTEDEATVDTTTDDQACGIEAFYRRKRSPAPPIKVVVRLGNKDKDSIRITIDETKTPEKSHHSSRSPKRTSPVEVKLRDESSSSDNGGNGEQHRKSAKIAHMANFWEGKIGSSDPPQQQTAGGSGTQSRPVSSASGTMSFVGDSQRLSAAEAAKFSQQKSEAASGVHQAKSFWESAARGSSGQQQQQQRLNLNDHHTNNQSPANRHLAPPPPLPSSHSKSASTTPAKPNATNNAGRTPTKSPTTTNTTSYYRNTVHSSVASTHAAARQSGKAPAQCELDTQSAGTVQGLRNRWELSSATGALLTPQTDNDDLANAAIRLARSMQPRRHFATGKSPTHSPGAWSRGPSPRHQQQQQQTAKSLPASPAAAPVNRSRVSSPDEDPDLATSIHVYDKQSSRAASSCAGTGSISLPTTPRHRDSGSADSSIGPDIVIAAPKTRSKSSGDMTERELHDKQVLEEYVDDVFEEVHNRPSCMAEEIESAMSPRHHQQQQVNVTATTVETEYEDQVSQLPSQLMADSSSASGGLTHSVSFYRQRMRQRTSASHKSPIQVLTTQASIRDGDSSESSSPNHQRRAAEGQYERRITELNEQVNVQQKQISQASQALNLCRTTLEFRGSREEVEAQRLLLLATEKRRVLLMEIDRVVGERRQIGSSSSRRQLHGSSGGSGCPTGTLTISHIAVPLKREFVNNNYNLNGEMLYYFICLVKHGARVEHTQLVTSDEGLQTGQLDFQHFMKLSGLQPDFRVRLERTIRESIPHDAKYRIRGATLAKAKGKSATLFSPGSHSQSPAGPTAVLDPSFQQVGHLDLSLSAVTRNKFRLDGCQFTNPIEGSVLLRLRCYAESAGDVFERGFLNKFEDVSGIGSWTRYWCVLREGVLTFWRYPDDEEMKKNALAAVHLSECVNREVVAVSREECARPLTFRLDLLPDGPVRDTTVRIILSADTRDDLAVWTGALNEALHNLHMWNPDVARQQAAKQHHSQV